MNNRNQPKPSTGNHSFDCIFLNNTTPITINNTEPIVVKDGSNNGSVDKLKGNISLAMVIGIVGRF